MKFFRLETVSSLKNEIFYFFHYKSNMDILTLLNKLNQNKNLFIKIDGEFKKVWDFQVNIFSPTINFCLLEKNNNKINFLFVDNGKSILPELEIINNISLSDIKFLKSNNIDFEENKDIIRFNLSNLNFNEHVYKEISLESFVELNREYYSLIKNINLISKKLGIDSFINEENNQNYSIKFFSGIQETEEKTKKKYIELNKKFFELIPIFRKVNISYFYNKNCIKFNNKNTELPFIGTINNYQIELK
jgi:hypothetical protein